MEPRANLSRFSRAWYGASIARFLDSSGDEVLGRLLISSGFSVEPSQRDAWLREVEILRQALSTYRDRGQVYLEFVVPRVGKRIDALLLLDQSIFVVEFKVGEKSFARADVEQVWDYALDLKNFHETSHSRVIVPVLVITGARG